MTQLKFTLPSTWRVFRRAIGQKGDRFQKVMFLNGSNYKVLDVRVCEYHDGYLGTVLEKTVFLEHEQLPGVRFGFLAQHFGLLPHRIQRTSWLEDNVPAGSVYVGDPSPWANPFILESKLHSVIAFYNHCKEDAIKDPVKFIDWLLPLVGRNLCSWCNIHEPSHADVLLALAQHINKTKSDFRTLVLNNCEDWPDLSSIIAVH